MKICLDTNVVLDVVLRREPFFRESSQVMSMAELGQHIGVLCATTLTNMHYLCRRELGEFGARQSVALCLQSMELAPVSRSVFENALRSPMEDFEDAVLAYAAYQAGASAIVTRNLRDFSKSPVRAYTPEQFLALPTTI